MIIGLFEVLWARLRGWSPVCVMRGHKLMADPTRNLRFSYRRCARPGCGYEKYLVDKRVGKSKPVGRQTI